LPLLKDLPWSDLQRPFLSGNIVLPEMWSFGLKSVITALGVYAPTYKVHYPEGLGEGLTAQVLAWKAYSGKQPLQSPEIAMISKYLEADCKSLWRIRRWLHTPTTPTTASTPVQNRRGGWYAWARGA